MISIWGESVHMSVTVHCGNEKKILNQSATMKLLHAVVNLVNAGLVDVHCHSIDNIFPDISQQHAT